jgi:hypothetical protein
MCCGKRLVDLDYCAADGLVSASRPVERGFGMRETHEMRVKRVRQIEGGVAIDLESRSAAVTAGLPGAPQVKPGDRFDYVRGEDRVYRLLRSGVEVATLYHYFQD